jgi:hypothetical protein
MWVNPPTLHELVDRVGFGNVLYTPGKQVIGVDDIQGSGKLDSELVGELIFASILASHRECVSHSITPNARHVYQVLLVGMGQSNSCTSISNIARYISNSDPESSSFFVFAARPVAPLDPYLDLCRSLSDSSPESSSRRFRSPPGRVVGIIAPHRTSTASSSGTMRKRCDFRR